MPTEPDSSCQWLRAGDEIFPALLAAINAASRSVCLEIYTFEESPLGRDFLEALLHARERGVQVRVLVDAIGSVLLSNSFWEPLRRAGGEVRVFNPIALRRVTIRNHRKLLVCDEQVAFVGGFNISPDYEGDGINDGWCDVGIKIEGPLPAQLASSFDDMFAHADFRHKRFMRWRKSGAKKTVTLPTHRILFSGPGRGRSPFKQALRQDLAAAGDVLHHRRLFSANAAAAARPAAGGAARRPGAIDSGRQIRRAARLSGRAEFVSPFPGARRGDIRVSAANSSRETPHLGQRCLCRFQQPRRAQSAD